MWVNGAEELLDHPEYVSKIDGVFKEEVYYSDSGSKQPASEVQYTIANLKKAIDAGIARRDDRICDRGNKNR